MTLLGGWAGFLAASSVTTSLAVLTLAHPAFPQMPFVGEQVTTLAAGVRASGSGAALFLTMAAVLSAMAAGLLVLAMWRLQRMLAEDREGGDRLALDALLAVGVIVVGVRGEHYGPFDDVASPLIVCSVLLLTAASVLLDRVLDRSAIASDGDDASFEAAATLLAQEIARDALQAKGPLRSGAQKVAE